ncbi:MAG TPA: 3-hydroxyanthranilate 3,4-dioxygenase [Chitinophagaceae bacterium]|nr:3-hydroxyanthranilate 3,4-dioxygenase [Chitinophagaceae bacterium]
MKVTRPFHLLKWIEEHKDQLKPPVGNIQVYKEAEDFIVMVVGGPNSRKDFHYNETEELFYQLQGDIVVRIIEEGKIVDIPIKEGEMFLLPPKVPHSPQRKADTIGLVIEKVRSEDMEDAFSWYCESCSNLLYEEFLPVKDIVKQLPPVMEAFYADVEKRTCSKCGHVMEPPEKI